MRLVAAVLAEVAVRVKPYVWHVAWAGLLLWSAWGTADAVLIVAEVVDKTITAR